MRHVHERAVGVAQTVVADIGDDSHNLAQQVLVAPRADAVADGIAGGEHSACERFVDDNHRRARRRVAIGERAAAHQRNAECPKVIGGDEVPVGFVVRGGRGLGLSFLQEHAAEAEAAPARRQVRCGGRGGDSGLRGELPREPLEEPSRIVVLRVARLRQRHARSDHAVDGNAGIAIHDLREAADQQAGAHHQHDRHCHLGDNERVTKANRRGPSPGAGGSFAHRRDGRLARTGDRREDAKQHDRPERQGSRSGERRYVQRHRGDERGAFLTSQDEIGDGSSCS